MTLKEFTKLAIDKWAAGAVAGLTPSRIERYARLWLRSSKPKGMAPLTQKAAIPRIDSPKALEAYSKRPLFEHLKSNPRLFGGMRIHGRQWK